MIRLRALGIKGLGWYDEITSDDETWWRSWFLALDQQYAEDATLLISRGSPDHR
jgi:hypothetical protein